MGGYGAQLALVLVLVLLNAALAGSEMAFISLRESQVRRLERRSPSGRVLARLARDPNRFLATIQIGITLAGFLASAAAAVALAKPLVGPLGFLGAGAEAAAVVLVTLVLTFLTLVLGELAPKRIAMQRAESWALLVARPLDALARITRPVVWLLGRSTDAVVRLTGGDPQEARDEVSVEEIRDMIAARRDVTAEQRTIISGAFEIVERSLRDILVPRRAVLTVPRGTPAADAAARLAASGHSRAPVTGDQGLDDVLGVVNLRTLVGASGVVEDHARPAMVLPGSVRVSDALRRMRLSRQQMALIVDEFGAVAGMVTMEDLVEEVIGEIYDETDRDVQSAVHEPDGAVLLPGAFPLHDLPDVGIDLRPPETGDYTTVAGLVLAALGQVPTAPGQRVPLAGYSAEVVALEGYAITRVRLRPTAPT
ncbi:hemolysin family protein [Spongisporangium articulatum]|uniref:Hemolysin family protein n=1 Tax=Spongisporangium articulatum TaxID=3362603 RepID=A0ABW8AU14_9ACTN